MKYVELTDDGLCHCTWCGARFDGGGQRHDMAPKFRVTNPTIGYDRNICTTRKHLADAVRHSLEGHDEHDLALLGFHVVDDQDGVRETLRFRLEVRGELR